MRFSGRPGNPFPPLVFGQYLVQSSFIMRRSTLLALRASLNYFLYSLL